MEKRIKIKINVLAPQAVAHARRLEALGAELEEKGLGKVDYKSREVIYDEKDEDAVWVLIRKHRLG